MLVIGMQNVRGRDPHFTWETTCNSAPPTSHLLIMMMGVVLLAAVKMLMKLMDVQMYSSPLIRTSSCLSLSSLAPFIHV